MGIILAISVFIYPLVMPALTFLVLLFVAGSLEAGIRTVIARAIILVPVLIALLGPGTLSTGAGSFLLPWWLHVMIGHQGVKYHIFFYTAACLALLVILVICVAAWHAVADSTNRRR